MSVEAGVETVPVKADKDERMVAHIVCGACYPEASQDCPMGTPAICGEKVLGYRPSPPYVRCRKCEKCRGTHYLRHVQGRGR